MIVTTTLLNPSIATCETIGEFDSGTILTDRFRAEHFEYIDIATDEDIVNPDPFPGTCNPRCDLRPGEVVELHASKPRVTKRLLEDISPLSDPVRDLKIGHEYRIKLKPQWILCYDCSITDLFGGEDRVPRGDLPKTPLQVVLTSDDEVLLKIVE